MIFKSNQVKFACLVLLAASEEKDDIFFRSMNKKKTIIRFGFCDIQNNQGKGYQPQPSVSAIIPTSTLIPPSQGKVPGNEVAQKPNHYC